MVHTVLTSRGGRKLIDEDNHVYHLDYSWDDITYWKCTVPKCKAWAKTIHNPEQENNSCELKVVHSNEHTHAYNPNEKILIEAKIKLKSMSGHTQDNTRTVVAKFLEDLPLSVASNLPSTTKHSRNVRKWRSEGLMAPPNPQTIHGFQIPLNYATTSNGEKFLLFY